MTATVAEKSKAGKPNLARRRANLDMVDDIEDLLLAGESAHQIAARLGKTFQTIERACQRAGRQDLVSHFNRRVAMGAPTRNQTTTPILAGKNKSQAGPIYDVSHAAEAAACKGLPTEWFFPDNDSDAKEAKQICARCPLQGPCLRVALENRESGIWAGTTFEERARMRRGSR